MEPVEHGPGEEREHDLVVRDRFSHASIHDGCRWAGAEFARTYPHMNMEALQDILGASNDDAACMGRLIVSDGSPLLRFWDPNTLQEIGRMRMTSYAMRTWLGTGAEVAHKKALLEEKAAKEVEVKAEGVDLFDEVDEEAVAEVLSIWTGIPVYKLTEEETTKLLNMEDELHKRIVGQNEAVNAVADVAEAGLDQEAEPGRRQHQADAEEQTEEAGKGQRSAHVRTVRGRWRSRGFDHPHVIDRVR